MKCFGCEAPGRGTPGQGRPSRRGTECQADGVGAVTQVISSDFVML